MKKRIYTLAVVFVLIFTSSTFAHPGRTDSSQGHKDNKNKSGLGSYHYHCGNSDAHLHKDGICPYGNSKSTSSNKVTTTPKKQAPTTKGIDVIVNGTTLSDAYAIQQDGRTIVAIRPICDALGVSLDWNASTQTAIGQKGNNIFQLVIGDKNAKVNNAFVELDVPGKVIDGKTLVPVRFIGESLGAIVNFDSSINAVIVTTNN